MGVCRTVRIKQKKQNVVLFKRHIFVVAKITHSHEKNKNWDCSANISIHLLQEARQRYRLELHLCLQLLRAKDIHIGTAQAVKKFSREAMCREANVLPEHIGCVRSDLFIVKELCHVAQFENNNINGAVEQQ